MDKFYCLLATVHIVICIACPGVAADNDNYTLYRLPRDLLPDSYEILLLSNVTTGRFVYDGQVNIHLRAVAKCNRVVLHIDKLNVIGEKSLLQRLSHDGGLEEVRIIKQSCDEETQFYVIDLLDDLTPGRYSLRLHFVGEVLDDVFGFYRSSYRDGDQIRWIGVTQFSPTFARRAFPCMDEPGFKATFQLSLGHYENETVSSNTFPESRDITDRANYYITRFSRTPRMSTYLLGWAIHGFNRINSTDPRIWLWTRLNDTQLAHSLTSSPTLVEGPKIYSALESWMGLSNPLTKVEHFAVPDFNFHAMENWGLITFRESVPLMWYESTQLQVIHNNLVTMGHEYAHTWFGNLVTPLFWNFGWLKEGFATYFAYFIIDHLHKDWRMMNLFALETLQSSLLDDSEDHNRTMNGQKVGSAKSAKAALDFVTYKKGASVIRMISDIVGEKVFKNAMHSYLQEKKFKASTPADLYKHLSLAINSTSQPIDIPVPINLIIDSWANQTNYPLIRATRLSPNKLRVSQERFLLIQKNKNNFTNHDLRFWWIPIRMVTSRTNSSQQPMNSPIIWLGSNKTTLIELPVTEYWYLLNPQQIGYYRVNYDPDNWRSLTKLLHIDFRRIPQINRAALIDDAFNLARAGYEKYDIALELVKYLEHEDEYEPWVAASRAFILLHDKLRDIHDSIMLLRRFAVGLITPIYKQLSFEERPSDLRIKKMQRNLVLFTACTLHLADCVTKAKSIFDNWIVDENRSISANLKDMVYRVGIFNGTDDDWIKLWQRFLKTDIYSEKEPMINALGCTENSSFIEKYLEFSIQPGSNIPKQYRLLIIQSIVSYSSKNIDTALNYLETNLNEIIDLQGTKFLEGIFSAISKGITSKVQKNKLTDFINSNANVLETILETIKKAIKSSENNIAWIKSCAFQISSYLS